MHRRYLSIYLSIFLPSVFFLSFFLSFFPTCQVRVVRFYASCLLLSSPFLLFSSFPPPQPQPSTPSVPCRTSTTTIHTQYSLPDLKREYPRPVFPARPQPRVSTPSVPCRTWTTTIHAQCSLPDLNHDHPRPVFPAGPQPRQSTPSVPCRTLSASIHAQSSLSWWGSLEAKSLFFLFALSFSISLSQIHLSYLSYLS